LPSEHEQEHSTPRSRRSGIAKQFPGKPSLEQWLAARCHSNHVPSLGRFDCSVADEWMKLLLDPAMAVEKLLDRSKWCLVQFLDAFD
jgi:hypothetical protein